MKYIFAVFLTTFFFLNATTYGTTYYISPAGNDSGPGTSSSKPWKTIARINAMNFKGDTILFLGGSTFYGSLKFTSSDVGTQTKPIVLGSYGTGRAIINSDTLTGLYVYNAAGFVVKNLVFTGVSRLTNKRSGIFFYLDKDSTRLSYLKMDSLEVYGYQNSGIIVGSWAKASGFQNISIANSKVHDNGKSGISTFAMEYFAHRNVSLRYNQVYNNPGVAEDTSTSPTGSGIVLGSVDVAVVEYCTSYNNGWLHKNTKSGGPVGIWAYQSDSVTFQFNESHHNKTNNGKDGGGFDFDGGCTNSIMQYNYSHDNYGGGFLVAQYSGALLMKNITIRYNISENDGRKNDQGSIHLWASGSSQGIKTVHIYNNTIYAVPSTGATPKAFYIRGGPISDIKVRNNIFQIKGGIDLIRVPYNTTACTLQGNSYWSSGSTFKIIWGSTTYSSLTAWRTATGQEQVNGTASGLQADAQFADTTTGVTFNDARRLTQLKRYKLKSTSTLVNKGLNLKTLFGTNVGTRDYWGNSLANKTTFHIGAFQGTPTSTTAQIMVSNRRIFFDNPQTNLQTPLYKENFLQVLSGTDQRSVLVRFALVKGGRASLSLYNIQGQLVSSLFSEEVQAGALRQLRIATDKFPCGVYLIHMENKGAVLTRKVLFGR